MKEVKNTFEIKEDFYLKENKIKIILYFNEINRIFIRYYFLTK